MVSNPPFELEDQTDEDFFDKLVNDDDEDDLSSKRSGSINVPDVLDDGNESDELKSFANLSVNEISVSNSVSDIKDVFPDGENEEQVVDREPNSILESADLPVLENGPVLEDAEVTAFEVVSDSGRDNSSPSSNVKEVQCSPTSVKEVQWSAFTDPASGGDDDFFASLGEGGMGNLEPDAKMVLGNEASQNATIIENSCTHSHVEYQGSTESFTEQTTNGGDTTSIEYWESLYPGWKYDANTGQWYQAQSGESANGQGSMGITADVQETFGITDVQPSQFSYAQQTAYSSVETVSQFSATENVSGWNYIMQPNGNCQYPAHMVFDPQYPGWYYDTIAQEWRSLESYHALEQSTNQIPNQQAQNGFQFSGYSHANSQGIIDDTVQNHRIEGVGKSLAMSSQDYGQQGANAEFGMASRSNTQASVAQSWQSSGEYNMYANSQGRQLSSDSTGPLTTHEQSIWSDNNSNWVGGLNNFSAENNFQLFNPTQQVHQNGSTQYPTDYYHTQYPAAVGQTSFSNGHHAPYSPSEGRSSAGRPPHSLVTFGFGGKLVVMKDIVGGFSTVGSKNSDGCSLSVHNLMEVVSLNKDPPSTNTHVCNYFHSLCHQSFPGPLVGGNAGSKDLYKWIDERIANSQTLETNHGKGQGLKLLLSLLKIACQHYGKLRSFGGDTGLKENDLPESAVAELFASAKRNGSQFTECNDKCLMALPSEAHIQTTATEVQRLLISGKKLEALQRAQEGQFWGFALVLARQLGEQFYADTVKQMAASQLVFGSPLRTLCLLIARKPEEVFSNSSVPPSNLYSATHMSPQPVQNAGSTMLDNWEENLAVITANRTENDQLVIMHLGDCLLKEKHDVAAAHICYLIAEAGFELYSDSARICLIGADHWNFPRTYASPEAIQRTELFEYAKVLGNSQFVLLQLQSYKLMYAHMLAEVGRVSDSLKYCQAVHKSLKIGRSPEGDTLKHLVSNLEERIRTHQQSGYAANLAPAKIVGKLLNFFDSTAHRVVGGLPPSGPSSATTQNSFQGNENQFQSLGPKVTGNQSFMGAPSLSPSASMDMMSSQPTISMPSLAPSASMEPINKWAVDGSKMTLQNRSISEPDIGRTPRSDQVDSSNEATSSSTVGKQSGSAGTSRFGRLNFGAQLLQKTVGFVLKPRQGRQAKLGDTNKFYYDEKLKRWVEEGAEPPPEESALPPPPTTAVFQNGKSDYNLKTALNNGLQATDGSAGSVSSTPESSPAFPPTLSSSNQFSARGRMGVRSRYVDTFNKGGGVSTNLFQAPSAASAKPANLTGAKFFIPSAAPKNVETSATEAGSSNEESESGETSSMSMDDPLQKLAPSPMGTIQRFPSVGTIPSNGTMESGKSSLAPQFRRASWSAIHNESYTSPPTTDIRAPPMSFMSSQNQMPGSLHMHRDNSGDESYASPPTDIRIPPMSFMSAQNHIPGSLHMHRDNSGDDLQEVEL
ncbi:unnamed protein product [Amaranthus hypochondriacus]